LSVWANALWASRQGGDFKLPWQTTIPTVKADGDVLPYDNGTSKNVYIYNADLDKFVSFEETHFIWHRDTQALSNSWLYSRYSMSAGADDEGQHVFPRDAVLTRVIIKLRMGGTGGGDGARLFKFFSKVKSVPDTVDTLVHSVNASFTAANDGYFEDDTLNIAVAAGDMMGVYLGTAGPEIAGNDPLILLCFKWRAA